MRGPYANPIVTEFVLTLARNQPEESPVIEVIGIWQRGAFSPRQGLSISIQHTTPDLIPFNRFEERLSLIHI